MVSRAIAFTLALLFVVAAPALATERPTGKPSATISIHQLSVAFIGSGAVGGGTLHYNGHSYPLTVNGLGVGGIGVSQIEAQGYVYRLGSVQQFPGSYGQARYGFAVGQASAGDLLLQNPSGVIMRLRAKRQGLMLSLGADAMVINMN